MRRHCSTPCQAVHRGCLLVTETDDRNSIGLILIIRRLIETGNPLSRQTIAGLAKIKLPKIAQKCDDLLRAMLQAGILEGDSDAFFLTPDGRNFADEISERYSLHALFYNEYYQAAGNSQAHALFCERVYGRNLSQHGVADMEQIACAVSELNAASARRLLDFGCGDGRITEYISDMTGMESVGIDIADGAIRLAQERTLAKRNRMNFYWADVEKSKGYCSDMKFDCILAIDSIFFGNQEVILRWLAQRLAPNGQMAVFYFCPSSIAAQHTQLAKAMEAIGLVYKFKDLTARNAEHCARKEKVLRQLEDMFREEGNDFLFKNRMAECTKTMSESHRYLYIIGTA
jgi:2-polyprenyl-3-methyl-5-hydroxy-6-metoxy-1,4-benzoquinol methylase